MLLYSVFWFLAFWAVASETNICWDDHQCVIEIHIQRDSLSGEEEDILPIEINCLQTIESSHVASKQERLHNISNLHRVNTGNSVTLDGCQTPFNTVTYGYEFLPDCGQILEVSVERFHGESALQFHCHTEIKLEVLKFANNEIASICANSFTNLSALREVFLSRNSIRHLSRVAFEGLLIRLIHIEHEEFLNIKEANFFEGTNAEDLRLIALKHLPVDLMQHLPKSIRFVLIADIDLKEREFIVVNPIAVLNISVINCNVETFILDDPHFTVVYLNLSRNAIRDFQQRTNSMQCSLQILDLSDNKLTYLRKDWLHNLQCIQTLALRSNQIKQLSLKDLFSAAPAAVSIDLRRNLLEDLEVADDLLQFDCDRVKISVDHNPWNCMWLLNFTRAHPDKFHIFKYKKLISKINVNGLECSLSNQQFFDRSLRINTTNAKQEFNTPYFVNRSTYTLTYGNHRDSKRNQRAEALVIVFLLPVGIVVLLVILYMWIYCQEIFHWSFYRSMPILGGKINAETSNHIEIDLQMSLTENHLQSLESGQHLKDESQIHIKAIDASDCNRRK